MSESSICVTCYKEYYRQCTCHEQVQLYTSSGKKRGRIIRPCPTCQKCKGKGYYLDEAPLSSVSDITVQCRVCGFHVKQCDVESHARRHAKAADSGNAPDAGALASIADAGADTTTVASPGDTVGH